MSTRKLNKLSANEMFALSTFINNNAEICGTKSDSQIVTFANNSPAINFDVTLANVRYALKATGVQSQTSNRGGWACNPAQRAVAVQLNKICDDLGIDKVTAFQNLMKSL
jgi:hypothetical protein